MGTFLAKMIHQGGECDSVGKTTECAADEHVGQELMILLFFFRRDEERVRAPLNLGEVIRVVVVVVVVAFIAVFITLHCVVVAALWSSHMRFFLFAAHGRDVFMRSIESGELFW